MICPRSGQKLKLVRGPRDEPLLTGGLREYLIEEDLALFLDYRDTTSTQEDAINSYARIISYYDQAIEWLFASTLTNETELRKTMIGELRLSTDAKVIDVGAGTARDSVEILNQLGPSGILYVQDISLEMLRTARTRLAHCDSQVSCRLIQGSAERLPFDDGTLDAVYSFGGLNEFGDYSAVLQEFARVVRVGGRVVVGDEGVAPWLVGTEHHRILAANNPIFFSNTLPIGHLPPNAYDVSLRWVLGNAFYLFSFTVGSSTPPLNLDLEHLGRRGGTLRSRYFGALDGVDPLVRLRAEQAAVREGVSMRNWLEATLLAKISASESTEP
jgi:ubiquinone/menaquinone biosynthesis C-methylase UbiE